MTKSYQHILATSEDGIGIITLNRPEVLNALCHALIRELVDALRAFDVDDSIKVIIITGSAKAFAAGADIKEMSSETTESISQKNPFVVWDEIASIRKPIIAAVSGFALGGGCELAMNCDLIVASETSQFGQPEINLGIIPGAGGTQRLSRLVGKHKAMELILTGRIFSAREALSLGLVNKVVPSETYLDETKVLAKEIAAKAPLAVQAGKQAILKAFDSPISEGLHFERKVFYQLFSSSDQKEGMNAFLEKRKPKFTGK